MRGPAGSRVLDRPRVGHGVRDEPHRPRRAAPARSSRAAPLASAHSDGTVEHSRFPVDISPHQPAFDIAGLSWRDDGLDVDVRFAGDMFEMEDQRNWTDASYKTYSRPLALPFPYPLAAGERVVQSIDVRRRDPDGRSTAHRDP